MRAPVVLILASPASSCGSLLAASAYEGAFSQVANQLLLAPDTVNPIQGTSLASSYIFYSVLSLLLITAIRPQRDALQCYEVDFVGGKHKGQTRHWSAAQCYFKKIKRPAVLPLGRV